MQAGNSPPSEGAAANGVDRERANAGRGVGGGRTAGHERVADIQRVRILAAMVEECSERGAGNVTVAHIVARAGVSRRTFYELYADREACFLGAFDEGVARASRYVLDGYDPSAKWVARVRSALVGLLSFLDAERPLGQLLVVGSLAGGASALSRRQNVLHSMISLVDEGRSRVKGDEQLPPLTAEGVVGGVMSVLHSRLIGGPPPAVGARRDGDADAGSPVRTPQDGPGEGLLELTGPLMGMVVLPYLGPAAARRELARPAPKLAGAHRPEHNPLGRLQMRLTYRTVRVLMAVAAHPGSSNRVVADAAEVSDQGQMSKLLARLCGLGLIANAGGGAARGEPNAWTLTEEGWGVQGAIAEECGRG